MKRGTSAIFFTVSLISIQDTSD